MQQPPGAPLPPPRPAEHTAPVAPPGLLASPLSMPSSPTIPTGAWVLLGAAIAAVIGALLPWARIHLAVGDGGLTATVNGTEGDGVITLVLGVALGGMAVLALATRRSTAAGVVAIVVGAAIIAIAVIDIVDVNRAAGDVSPVVEVSVGAGLWVTLIAGAVGLIGGVLLLAQRRRPVPLP